MKRTNHFHGFCWLKPLYDDFLGGRPLKCCFHITIKIVLKKLDLEAIHFSDSDGQNEARILLSFLCDQVE